MFTFPLSRGRVTSEENETKCEVGELKVLSTILYKYYYYIPTIPTVPLLDERTSRAREQVSLFPGN